jgi:hypothetical protein
MSPQNNMFFQVGPQFLSIMSPPHKKTPLVCIHQWTYTIHLCINWSIFINHDELVKFFKPNTTTSQTNDYDSNQEVSFNLDL